MLYFVSFILQLFHVPMNFLHDASPLGFFVSIVAIVIASMNLIMDFDFIESGERNRAPKYMEWYSGFALLLTLVWLYMEILRLLGRTLDSYG